MIFVIITKNLKGKEKINYIALALFTLFLHSMIDFNLSFMYMLVFFFAFLGTIRSKEKEYKILEICAKILVTVLIVISTYFATEMVIDKTKYSEKYIFNQMIETGNIEEKLDEMINRRKYVSHINEISYLLEREDLEKEEYQKMFDVLKSEEYLLNNNIYLKVKEIEIYKKLLDNIDIKEEIIKEISYVKEMLKNPEKHRITFEEIDNYLKILNEIEKEVK